MMSLIASRSIYLTATQLPIACAMLLLLAGCTQKTTQPDSADSGSATSVKQNSATSTDSASTENRPAATFHFETCPAAFGLEFQYSNGEESGHFSILESLGGGLAAIDIDQDGYDDLCIAGGGHFSDDLSIHGTDTGLFRNMSGTQLQDVSILAGVAQNDFYSHGVVQTDFDCDGFSDFLITGYGGLQLFHNLGDGTFGRIDAVQSGLTDSAWSSSAAWGDFNSDGFPDLYVTHYVDWSFDNHPFCEGPEAGKREVCPPRSFAGIADTLYLSQGNGQFTDVSAASGLRSDGKGLGVLVTDLDGNGTNDIYVTNDTVPNHLYQNDSHGQFSDVSLLSGTALSDRGVPDGSMGVDVCDYNLDGRPDLWVVNYERENSALYESSGNMVFRHVSQRAGINSIGGLYVGWGTCCQDFDLDGDEDMFVSNGHVIRYPVNAPLNQRPLLLSNSAADTSGNPRFINLSDSVGDYFLESHMGRGAVVTDLENDGDFDLVISRTNQPAVALRNMLQPAMGWLQLHLIGTTAARQPVGARVVITMPSGQQTRMIRSGGSYASSNSLRICFGGLPVDQPVSQIRIDWPSGQQDVLPDLHVNQLHVVTERSGQTARHHTVRF